jgi:hypothetical protein
MVQAGFSTPNPNLSIAKLRIENQVYAFKTITDVFPCHEYTISSIA